MNETALPSTVLLGLDISIVSLDLLRHATISRLLPYLIQIQFDSCQPAYISLPGDLAIYRPFVGGTGCGHFALLQGHIKHFCQKKRFRVSVVVLQQSPKETNIDSTSTTPHEVFTNADTNGYIEHSRGETEWDQDPSSSLYLVDGNTMSSRLRVFGAPAILATFPSIKIDLLTVAGDSCGSLRVAIAVVDALKVTDRRRIASTGRVVPDTRRTTTVSAPLLPTTVSLSVPLHDLSSTSPLPAAASVPSSSAAAAAAVQLPLSAQTPTSTAASFGGKPARMEETIDASTTCTVHAPSPFLTASAVTPTTPSRITATATMTSAAVIKTTTDTETVTASSSSSSAAAAAAKASTPSVASSSSTPAAPPSPSLFAYEREELDESPSDSRDYTTKDEGESAPSRCPFPPCPLTP